MDWRQDLADYDRAKAGMAQAEILLADSLAAFGAARDGAHRLQDLSPAILGVELARRRLRVRVRRFEAAEYRLTGGRPIDEVLWSLPDDP
ncbi:hypothetical protein [Phenylobacterium sp.]|uniref:hypothetical protein n=1 Tax=Phenylobacterium sp. TaxID=1871053 RepID=UPI001202B361|nr:hypothetical protein [Phenylobacterium sp.]THD58954.1 MAG: hypothetical protein E8A49_18385 [Phenylobacterium sp.]